MYIHILPQDVSSKIAAGEVIERPVSVVKELVENSIDAEANEIHIKISNAGKALIEVYDNGIGMSKEDLPLAVARFATSKINEEKDLYTIRTLGFRGEALSSIAAVSKLTIKSYNSNQKIGGYLGLEGGEIVESYDHAMPNGTLITVEDLFFNVPARLKFLKKDNTERQLIIRFIQRYALAYPSIRFSLHSENTSIILTTGNGNRREILSNILGLNIAQQMIEVSSNEGPIQLEGFISPVGVSRSNRKEISVFVNGRWIQDAALISAIQKAYQNYLMVGRYPIVTLFLQIDPAEIDVNVHPAKTEIRFRDTNLVFSLVARAIRKALLTSGPASPIFLRTWRDASELNSNDFFPLEIDYQTNFPDNQTRYDDSYDKTLQYQSNVISGTQQIPLLRLVGQIGGSYIVAEGPDGLYLIDQHAAHERILFEKLYLDINNKSVKQQLLEPEVIELPLMLNKEINSIINQLNKMGFSIEEFGQHSYQVRAIPQHLSHMNPKELLIGFIEPEEAVDLLKDENEKLLIARICKKAAIKAGQILSQAEQTKLLRDLEACENPRTCPHGRPTMIHLSVELLERQFGRRGSR